MANRGVILKLHSATAIYRMLEFYFIDRRFFNPIEAVEAEKAAREAMYELGQKLIQQFTE